MPVAKRRPVGRPRKQVRRTTRPKVGRGVVTEVGKIALKEAGPPAARFLIKLAKESLKRKLKRGRGVRLAGRGAYLA